MNAHQNQGREAGTIEAEDAQKPLCSQLADAPMTTVKNQQTKPIWFVFIPLHLKLFLPREAVVL